MSADQSQTVLAVTGILQESREIRRELEESTGNTGIPVPQEFMQKNPIKVAKNRNFQDPSKTTFLLNKFLQENRKKESSGVLFFSVFQTKK